MSRRLQDVLQVWPQVRLQLGQHCTLVVYYGFSKAFVTWGKANVADFDAWQAVPITSRLSLLETSPPSFFSLKNRK